MLCPRCSFEGEPVRGRCQRCGYTLTAVSAQSPRPITPSQSMTSYPAFSHSSGGSFTPMQPLVPGDVLQKGRYRLVTSMAVPQNQQGQGRAWAAIDRSRQQRPVIVREVRFPIGRSWTYPQQEQWIHSLVQRLTAIAQFSNLPKVSDVFREQGICFIIFLRPEGVTLSTFLALQGNTLPERMVAEWGWQLCDMLVELAALNPPMIHGSISPDTIIVRPDGNDVSLILLPLFPLEEPQTPTPSSAYSAPEQTRHAPGSSPSSDLYAVAAVMHHAVTGYDPRERVVFFYPPVRRLNPVVSPRMEAILSRQLRLTDVQRYPSPAAMRQDLIGLLESLTGRETNAASAANPLINPVTLSPEERRELRSSTALLDIGVMLAIGVILIVGVIFAVLFTVLHP